MLPWWLTLWLYMVTMISASDENPIAKPGCQDRCGNISIPYPFGIGLGCSLNPWFNVSCERRPPKPYLTRLLWVHLGNGNTSPAQILDINLDPIGPTTLAIGISYDRGRKKSVVVGEVDIFAGKSLNMTGSPFALMAARNVLVVNGCGGSVAVKDAKNDTVAGCSTICSPVKPKLSGYMSCYGVDCCQTSIAVSLDFFQTEFLATNLKGHNVSDLVEAAVFDTEYLAGKSLGASFSETRNIPTILEWSVPDLVTDSPDYSNSTCQRTNNATLLQGLYACRCKHRYYTGNPYLPNGCQVIKECGECPDNCVAAATTVNNSTTYLDQINNSTSYSCPKPSSRSIMPLLLGLGISLGTLIVSILLYGMYRLLKKRKDIKQKQNNFKKNGGLLLQQQLSAGEDTIERIKIYTSDELEKATDNFNENRIVGRGGQGTVYKGMLHDGTIAAIKKSEKVSGSSQLKQFINEVALLSQVNHRNVVKLFGCCLETEVPLLVYEYVINGTLSENIRNPTEEFQLTWKMRIQIAIQSAEALAYLHSSSDPPIYHRDVKTSNILLDDKYRAKVSDFGISKSIEIDQTHVTNTHVEGTYGYIDPEFFRSRQYTDKSDVYSFGVVLVEIITSRKAVYEENSLAINLASTFVDLKQNGRMYDIVDANVLEEARKEELEGVANLAEQCLQMTGRQRPTMKEVVTQLLMITSQPRVTISLPDQVSDGKFDLVGEFSSSEEDPKHPLLSSTFSSSTSFGM